MKKQVTYRDLETWQAAMTLVERCYEATKAFPSDERFGLTGQLRRAAVSIPANVAEGACRHNDSLYANHVNIALGSHAEVETLLELAFRLGFLGDRSKQHLQAQADTVGRLLNGLRRSFAAKLTS
jgi:four helix bundle protein